MRLNASASPAYVSEDLGQVLWLELAAPATIQIISAPINDGTWRVEDRRVVGFSRVGGRNLVCRIASALCTAEGFDADADRFRKIATTYMEKTDGRDVQVDERNIITVTLR